MLYLEDFLEIVENLPQELRDRTTDLRELDLGIQNTSDQIDEQIKTFFGNAKKMKLEEREALFNKIRKEYYKLLDDADEKVNIASTMHDTLERYVRKLDQELEKFKCELEADSPGITEILEKRSLELDEPAKDNLKDKYFFPKSSSLNSSGDWRSATIKKEDLDPSLPSNQSSSPPPTLSYSLGHIGPGSNALAAAASQAIAATQQMRHGRKTASLVASYDAITQGIHANDFTIGGELAKAALSSSTTPNNQDANSNGTGSSSSSLQPSTKRQKKSHRLSSATTKEPSPVPSDDLPSDVIVDPMAENCDWTYDPNEPRYCICNQVSYGDMVACDNPKCPVEWFHYPCVGIMATPKGKWYCPQCSTSMNRRQRK